nr:alpha/beta hydrolase [Streptomyces sudanensis]
MPAAVCKVPGGAWLLARLMRVPSIRNGRRGYGGLSLRGVPDEIMDDWFTPIARNGDVRRDFAKFATSAPGRKTLLDWSGRLRSFDGPVLVVWATEDPLMPREHGPRLAELYPEGRLVEIGDSSTLVPEDQPERLAEAITDFLTRTGAEPVRRTA